MILGYLQGRDCGGHYKPMKRHSHTGMWQNTTCYNSTDGILVISRVVLFACCWNTAYDHYLLRCRRAEVRSMPCVSTIYGQSTCSEVRKFKNRCPCNCTQPQYNAMLKISLFTTFCTNLSARLIISRLCTDELYTDVILMSIILLIVCVTRVDHAWSIPAMAGKCHEVIHCVKRCF